MALPGVILLIVCSIFLVRAYPFPFITTESPAISMVDYRLPSIISPISYEIKIILYLRESNFSFNGESEIKVKVFDTTNKVTLHAKNLQLENAFVVSDEGRRINSTNHEFDKVTDFLSINFEGDLIAYQEYSLFLEYRGVLNDRLDGFFKLSYDDNEGRKVWLAATRFQPFGARQAFPCFDEPGLKATFSISIKHPKQYHALSNMHIMKLEPASDETEMIWTTFAKTPKMSTYLVAFVISDFVKLENVAHDFRIWARREKIENARYAMDVGQKLLKVIEEYTGIPRESTQFVKIDSVALPDLPVQAMENWGLITYKETALLVRDELTAFEKKQFIATVASHEFVHQWFGNLVTPKEWRYLWLSEGFANYFQAYCTDKVEPTWKLNDLYVLNDLQTAAFGADAIESVSMNHPVRTPKEFEKKISTSSYQKAGSIFRMISHIITEVRFQKSLMRYLKKMSSKAAIPDDLFDELSAEYEKSGLTQNELREAFNNWTNTSGFPIVTVIRNYSRNSSVVTQNRFFIKDDPNHKENYWVPINYAQQKSDFDNTTVKSWLRPNDISITIEGLKNDQWAIFNIQHFGYYRVNYDQKNWELIIGVLNSEQFEDIHVLNRGQLLDDAFRFAETMKLNWSIALGLASYLKREKNYIPWKSASSGLLSLRRILWGTEYWKDYQGYVLDLLEHWETTMGYELSAEDDHMTKFFKGEIRTLGCTFGSAYCSQLGYSSIKNWLENPARNPDLNDDEFCAGVRNISQSKWNEFHDKSLETNIKGDVLRNALACSSDKTNLKHYLDAAGNSSGLPFVTAFRIFKSSDQGMDIILDFIHEKCKEIAEAPPEKKRHRRLFFLHLDSYINSETHLNKFKAFIEIYKKITGTNSHIELFRGEENVQHLKKIENDIGGFLDQHKLTSAKKIY